MTKRKKPAPAARADLPRAMVAEETVTVGDQEYTIRADMNALAEFEEKTGRNAMEALQEFQDDEISVVSLRNLVWCLLQRHHPNATLAEAGDVLSHDMAALGRVFEKAFPEPEKGAEEDEDADEDAPGNGTAPGS